MYIFFVVVCVCFWFNIKKGIKICDEYKFILFVINEYNYCYGLFLFKKKVSVFNLLNYTVCLFFLNG